MSKLNDFIKNYSESSITRLHMPGHKGAEFLGFEKYDITEIYGADSLYEADGLIKESEQRASDIFNTKATFYSAEGSSQCVKAMISLVKLLNKDNCTVLSTRNCHKSFIYASALLNVDIKWLYNNGEYSLAASNVLPEDIESALNNADIPISAVYLTSPDYLGNELNIKDISKITCSKNIPLIVDNAHGSYLHFLDEKRHPIDLGADMCCDSAHKTLPVLTGGAYLHISKKTPDFFKDNVKYALEMFGSTSPSYLILSSLDLANDYLSNGFDRDLKKCVNRLNKLKENLKDSHITPLKTDPLKLTIPSYGLNIADMLRKSKIECEYQDPDYVVMMFSPLNGAEDFIKTENALKNIYKNIEKNKKTHPPVLNLKPEKVLSVREAIFSPFEIVDAEHSFGRTLARPAASCPPCVSVLMPGERIEEDSIKIFKKYSINKIPVVI